MKQLIRPMQQFSQRESKTRISKFIKFPLIRIVIALLFIAPVIAFHNLFSIFVLDNLEKSFRIPVQFTVIIVTIIMVFIAYGYYTRLIENREAFELKTKRCLREVAMGIAIGGGLVVLILVLLILSGFYKIEHLNSPFVLLERIFRYGIGSFLEEMIFTIILFRLTEEFAGTIVSIITISLLFGLMHLGNDNATISSSVCISLEHIIILAPFILTRRIWMVWAIHFSWNYFQTAVFGMNNSGMAHEGFITPAISGPVWITGGSFGIEASYVTIALQILAGSIILWYAVKCGQFLKYRNARER